MTEVYLQAIMPVVMRVTAGFLYALRAYKKPFMRSSRKGRVPQVTPDAREFVSEFNVVRINKYTTGDEK